MLSAIRAGVFVLDGPPAIEAVEAKRMRTDCMARSISRGCSVTDNGMANGAVGFVVDIHGDVLLFLLLLLNGFMIVLFWIIEVRFVVFL